MARRTREPGQGKHLRSEDSRPRRRGRKVVVTLVVVLAVLAALGYTGWQEGWLSEWLPNGWLPNTTDNSEAQVAASSQEVAEAATTTNESGANEPANDETPASDGTAAESDATGEDATADAATASDDESAEEATETHPGEHGAFTDDDLAAMASLKGQIAVTGAGAGFADSDGYQELLYQVAVWQRAGHALGFVLTDLGSGATVSYNVDQVFYPASSIKAPYVCSLYQELVENGTSEADLDPVAANAIINSDNDAFRQLHASYGEGAFSTWLQAANVPATTGHAYSYFTQYYYPQISTAQLDLMWAAIYSYCTSGTGPSQVLAGYLSQRTTSPIAEAVGDRYTSWGKAGWYYSSGDYGAEPATVDAGIVFADQGPYRLVMMSDAPGELDQMASLAWGMDAAAADLTA